MNETSMSDNERYDDILMGSEAMEEIIGTHDSACKEVAYDIFITC